jgi:hypothetical protein
MCCLTESMTQSQVDEFADLKRGDRRLGAVVLTMLLAAIAIASTTFHLKGLEAAASIILY